MAFTLVLLILSVLPTAQSPAPPTLAAAAARLQAQDPAGAARILEAVTAREPANGRAWRLLGVAYQRVKELDKALAADRKALELEPDAPQVLYNIGTAYALKQEADAAFDWLRRAKATRRLDMTQIETDADLSALKTDPGFRALLPAPEDFAQPFVEPVRVIREWDGEAVNDQFGWIARVIGDVDRDGVPGVVTSAPTKHIGGAAAGRVYVYSTRSGALPGASTDIPAINSAPASKWPATPTTTAFPTSSPARRARARPTCTPARTAVCC